MAIPYNTKTADRLVKLYRDTYKDILSQIDSATDFGKFYRLQTLSYIDNELKMLAIETDKFIKTEIPKQYRSGVNEANEGTKQLNLIAKSLGQDPFKIVYGFNVQNRQMVEALMSDASKRFGEAISGVGRSAKNITNMAFQRQVRAKIAEGTLTGTTRKEIVSGVKTLIKEQGLTAIKDKGGRTWTIDRYSDMLVRTKLVEARNTGLADRMLQNGQDLVQVSQNGSNHAECRKYEGKILSLTGNTKGYTSLDQAMGNGLFHPNCKHTINPIDVELASKTYGWSTTEQKYVKAI